MKLPVPSETVLGGCKELSGFLQASAWEQLLLSNPTNRPSKAECQKLIQRYTVAFAGESQAWLGIANAFVRHEKARCITTCMLRAEFGGDHISLLHEFAVMSDAIPDKEAHEYTEPWLQDVRRLFGDTSTCGINGLVVLAMLKGASALIMPILRTAAAACACTDFAYVLSRENDDPAYTKSLLDALDAESKEGYPEKHLSVQHVTRTVVTLLQRIFADP